MVAYVPSWKAPATAGLCHTEWPPLSASLPWGGHSLPPGFEVCKEFFLAPGVLLTGGSWVSGTLTGCTPPWTKQEHTDAEQQGMHFMWEFFGFLCQRKQQIQFISQDLPSAAWLHRQLRPAPACPVPGDNHSSAARATEPCLGSPEPWHPLQGSGNHSSNLCGRRM